MFQIEAVLEPFERFFDAPALMGKLANTTSKARTNTKQKMKPKYQNPADNLQSWTGRGRQPKWIAEGLANGKVLNDFRI